jgi:hypothetical protein
MLWSRTLVIHSMPITYSAHEPIVLLPDEVRQICHNGPKRAKLGSKASETSEFEYPRLYTNDAQ